MLGRSSDDTRDRTEDMPVTADEVANVGFLSKRRRWYSSREVDEFLDRVERTLRSYERVAAASIHGARSLDFQTESPNEASYRPDAGPAPVHSTGIRTVDVLPSRHAAHAVLTGDAPVDDDSYTSRTPDPPRGALSIIDPDAPVATGPVNPFLL